MSTEKVYQGRFRFPSKWVVGIDPDVDKSGICIYNKDEKAIDRVLAVDFWKLYDLLLSLRSGGVEVILEAGWLNASNWHINSRQSRRMAAAIGNNVGRNEQVGRLIGQMCRYLSIPCQEVKPLALRRDGFNVWHGADGKASAIDVKRLTGYDKRTNQEMRDAILLVWKYK